MNRHFGLLKFWISIFVISGFLLTANHSGYAQQHLIELVPMGFEQLNVEHGLSQSSINSIYQDQIGFMWFCTEEGLNRFDGYQFKVYKHDPTDSNSIADDFVWSILQDKSGIFWITTNTGGLDRFDPVSENFTHYRHDPNNENSLGNNFVAAVHQDKEGFLWIGTLEGLDKFDIQNNRFTHYRHDPKDSTSLLHNYVYGFYEDDSERLYAITLGGLCQFDKRTNRFLRFTNSPNRPKSRLSTICGDGKNLIWLGTYENGVYEFDQTRLTFDQFFKEHPDPLKKINDNGIEDIYATANTLWIGTTRGLDKFDLRHGVVAHYEHDIKYPMSLSNSHVTMIFEDRSGVLWIGTRSGGINKLQSFRKNFKQYRLTSGDIVWSICQDQYNSIWVGSDGSGLLQFDPRSNKVINYKNNPNLQSSLSSNVIQALYLDRRGKLWIGTRMGLNRFDDGHFTRYLSDPTNPNSLSSNNIISICEDSSGNFWVGTDGAGLNRFDPLTGKCIQYKNDPQNPNSLSQNKIRRLYTDRSGKLWIGTRLGLDCFDEKKETFSHYRHNSSDSNSLSGLVVTAIFEDKEGMMWIGTMEGLNKFDRTTNKYTRYLSKNGLPSLHILSILEDEHNNLWICTNSGISKFNKTTQTFTNFDALDGLQSEFSPAAYQNKNGEMLFGGINGFNFFHPDSIRDNGFIPPLIITAFQKNNHEFRLPRSIVLADQIDLDYDDRVISFEFAALNYMLTQKNQYAYKLEGFDEDWVNASNKRSATYTNLEPGNYIFLVKGSNNDGIWNPVPTKVRIHIEPPFWKTWWFMLLIIGAVCYTVFILIRFRIQSLIKIEKIRMRIATDLHDTIGSGLTDITILTQVIMQDAKTFADQKMHSRLNRIIETSKSLTQSLAEIVWLINPSCNSIYDLVNHLKDFYQDTLSSNGIVFKVDNIEVLKDMKLSPEVRQHIYLLFKEAINNSIKHSRGNELILSMASSNNSIFISLKDNGIGFDQSYAPIGYGLSNMKKRAEICGGSLDIDSKPSEGTKITFSGLFS
ncbi:hypothetical protein K1X84_12940 [bacterium]|nr:hypothetical protein [bacterium]